MVVKRGRVSAWWAKGKSLSWEVQPLPHITRTKWRKSAIFGMFLFIFCFHFAPLWNTFPPYDAPKPRFPPHKFCRCQNHHWVPCVGLVGEMHSYLSWLLPFNSELKKKRKKKERKTDTFSNNAIPLTVPTHPHPIPVTHPTNTLIWCLNPPQKKE